MIAKEKWQVKTIQVLEKVFDERQRQVAEYGHNEDLEDGIGPDVTWIPGLRTGVQPAPGLPTPENTAKEIQEIFREDYEKHSATHGKPTWMHLVREELSEAFELNGDDPAFVEEILQVAALCVSWVEKKL